jgi:hypothetical protein
MNGDMPKILIISRNGWRNDNSTGNTLSNFFSKWDKDKIANLYCRAEIPSNNLCGTYFQITEKALINNLLKRKPVGKKFYLKNINDNDSLKKNASDDAESEKRLYDYFRSKRFSVLLFMREVLWKLARWDNKEFKSYLDEVKPEIIYMHAHDSFYMHDIFQKAQKYTGAKANLFFSDDTCSYRQFSLSPLFWLRRVCFRRKLKKSVSVCNKTFGTSDKICEVYEKIFNRKISPLYKAINFETKNEIKEYKLNEPLKMLYSGGILAGRWQTLAEIGSALKNINSGGIKIQLFVYTPDRITKGMMKKLDIKDSVFLMGSVGSEEIRNIQKMSDILVHVESLGLKNKLITHLSFSTKIVDYFESGKCIFAVGWEEAASIDYLKRHDAAVVVNDFKKIEESIIMLIKNKNLINEYGQKALKCGFENHQSEKILKNFYETLIDKK